MTKGLRLEWDMRKSLPNKAKYGVSFEVASQVFGEVMAIAIPDPHHDSGDECREITIGDRKSRR